MNLVFFTLIVTLLLTTIAAGTTGLAELREDLPALIFLSLSLATFMAVYTCHLYRRSWNRRAQSIAYLAAHP